MIKRPFMWMFAAFCLGVVCRKQLQAAELITLFVYIAAWVLLKIKPGLEHILLKKSLCLVFVPAFFLLGAVDGEIHSRPYDVDMTLLREEGRKAEGIATGRVSSVTFGGSGYKLILDDFELRLEGENFTQGRLLVYMEDADPIKLGNRIEIIGYVRDFASPENPGQFDEKSYYRTQELSCRFYAENYLITDQRTNIFKEALRRLREGLGRAYDALFPPEEAGTVKAMVLGDKSTLSEDIRELYKNNGIGHILAISGLHISMIGGAVFNLLRGMKWSMLPATGLTELLLLIYGFVTGFSVSTIRAVFMLTVSMLAKLLGKSYDSCEACALCGLGLLVVQPLLLFQTGFLLSFAAALGIGLFRIEFSKWKAGAGPGLTSGLIKAILSAFSPQLVTTPIILSAYYEIPTFSLLINLVLLPFMGLLVAFGILCGFTFLIWEKPAELMAGGVYYLLRFYRLFCEGMSEIPGNLLLFGHPGRLRLFLCYGLLVVFFIVANYLGYKHRREGKGAYHRRKAAWLLLLVPLVFIKPPYNALGITHLSVGQGDCAVLQLTNNSAIMIDCGSTSSSDIAKYYLEPFLKYSGVDTLEAIFISHPDKDHISGIQELLETQDDNHFYHGTVLIKRIIATPQSLASGKLDGILKRAAEKNITVEALLAGDVFIYNDLKITCLGPNNAGDTADNDGSMILLAGYYDFDAVFMGDSAAPGEAAVLAAQNAGLIKEPLELLKVAHHGSKNASSESFIRAVKPEIAVLSYGRGNSYGHPHARVVNLLEELNSIIYKTGQFGAACFKIQKKYK